MLFDTVELVATLLAAMRIGAIPLPLNSLLPGRDLALTVAEARARVARGLCGASDRRRRAGRRRSRARARDRRGRRRSAGACCGRRRKVGRAGLGRPGRRGPVRHVGRLPRLLALHVRDDRPAEARHAPPCRPADHGGGLRARGARHRPRRPLLLRRAALPRLRARQRARLSRCRWVRPRSSRRRGPRSRTGSPRSCRPSSRRCSSPCRPSTPRCSAPISPKTRSLGAARRVRRRGAAGRAVHALPRALRRRDPRRDRLDGDDAHLRLEPARPLPPRLVGHGGRRLPRQAHGRRGGNDVGPGTPGQLWVSGDSAATGYWCHTDATRQSFHGEWLRSGDMYVESGTASTRISVAPTTCSRSAASGSPRPRSRRC